MKLQFNKYKIHHFGKDYTILTPKASFDNLYVCEADSNRNIVFGNRKDLINVGNYIGCLYSQQNTILYVPTKKKPTDYLKDTFQIDRAYDLVLSSHSVQLKLKDWKAIRQNLKKHEVVSLDIKLPPIKDEDTRNFWYKSNKDVLRIKTKYDTLFLEASKIIYRHMIEIFYYVGENGEEQFHEYVGSHCHEHLDVYMGYNNRTSIDTINTVEFYDEELWKQYLDKEDN